MYLSDVVRLPPVPKTKLMATSSGSYWLGEGRYTVKWLLFDNGGRVCRKEWQVEAQLSSAELAAV